MAINAVASSSRVGHDNDFKVTVSRNDVNYNRKVRIYYKRKNGRNPWSKYKSVDVTLKKGKTSVSKTISGYNGATYRVFDRTYNKNDKVLQDNPVEVTLYNFHTGSFDMEFETTVATIKGSIYNIISNGKFSDFSVTVSNLSTAESRSFSFCGDTYINGALPYEFDYGLNLPSSGDLLSISATMVDSTSLLLASKTVYYRQKAYSGGTMDISSIIESGFTAKLSGLKLNEKFDRKIIWKVTDENSKQVFTLTKIIPAGDITTETEITPTKLYANHRYNIVAEYYNRYIQSNGSYEYEQINTFNQTMNTQAASGTLSVNHIGHTGCTISLTGMDANLTSGRLVKFYYKSALSSTYQRLGDPTKDNDVSSRLTAGSTMASYVATDLSAGTTYNFKAVICDADDITIELSETYVTATMQNPALYVETYSIQTKSAGVTAFPSVEVSTYDRVLIWLLKRKSEIYYTELVRVTIPAGKSSDAMAYTTIPILNLNAGTDYNIKARIEKTDGTLVEETVKAFTTVSDSNGLPEVIITDIKHRTGKSYILIDWKNDKVIDGCVYTLQKSTDGSAYTDVQTITVPSSGALTQVTVDYGKQYFRIKVSYYDMTPNFSNAVYTNVNQTFAYTPAIAAGNTASITINDWNTIINDFQYMLFMAIKQGKAGFTNKAFTFNDVNAKDVMTADLFNQIARFIILCGYYSNNEITTKVKDNAVDAASLNYIKDFINGYTGL